MFGGHQVEVNDYCMGNLQLQACSVTKFVSRTPTSRPNSEIGQACYRQSSPGTPSVKDSSCRGRQ